MGKKHVVTSRQAYAASIFRKHLTALVVRVDGVQAGREIEAVHKIKMRVASRRLRTALSLFEDIFPA